MQDFAEMFNELIRRMDSASSFLITGTASADGDSVGAQLALRRILLQLKKASACHIDVINQEACPPRYAFLPDADTIQPFAKDRFKNNPYDMAFALDGGSERSGDVKPYFDQAKCKVLIDHHLHGSDQTYDIPINNPDASSTAEVVYDIMVAAGTRARLDQELATQLYLAISFDTGSFRHSLTTPKTMRVAAELIATGIDFSWISNKGMFETSAAAKQLLGEVLANLRLENQGRLSWTPITKELIQSVGAKEDDHERIINHLLDIDTVEVACLLYELPKRAVKVSLRSKGSVDVGALAREVSQEGGGHARAAGCKFRDTTMDAACELMLSAISACL